MGTRKLYDLLDDNLSVQMLRTAFTNDPEIVRKNKRMTAINSAIEIDVTGQVCADSIGTKIYSGIGGQLDCVSIFALN
jgi:acyl-CoA hydrolase